MSAIWDREEQSVNDGLWRWGYWSYRRDFETGEHYEEFVESDAIIDTAPYGTRRRHLEGSEPILDTKSIGYDGETEFVITDENKRRLVASVNALRHLSVEEIEAMIR